MEMINVQRAQFKVTPEIDPTGQSILPNFYCCNSEWSSVVCFAPTCLYACLTAFGPAPNEMTGGVLEELLSDLDQDINELLDCLRCSQAAPEGPKQEVPEMLCFFL